MKGKALIQFLGYSVDHPQFIAFLQEHEINTEQLPNPLLPEKKENKKLYPRFFEHGFGLNFERNHPQLAKAHQKADPEGIHFQGSAQEHLVKNPIGNGPIYFTSVDFFEAKQSTDPVQLPFGLQIGDSKAVLTQKFGAENLHGTSNNPYQEADEKDFYHDRYHIYVYFERNDPQERLKSLTVQLK